MVEWTDKGIWKYKIQLEHFNPLGISFIGNEKRTTSLRAAGGKILPLYIHGAYHII